MPPIHKLYDFVVSVFVACRNKKAGPGPEKMTRRILVGLCLWQVAGGLQLQPLHADIEYWRVVDVSGSCEVLEAAQSDWRPLASPSNIREGSQIRTGKAGTVDIALDRGGENAIRVNSNSALVFLQSRPRRIRLISGSLFALQEREKDPVEVLTGRLSARLAQGGMAVIVGARQDAVKVFGESAQISSSDAGGGSKYQILSEGLKLSRSGGKTEGTVVRMDFADYQEWQTWFKLNDERKDRFLLGRR